jgi:hypothetical protein
MITGRPPKYSARAGVEDFPENGQRARDWTAASPSLELPQSSRRAFVRVVIALVRARWRSAPGSAARWRRDPIEAETLAWARAHPPSPRIRPTAASVQRPQSVPKPGKHAQYFSLLQRTLRVRTPGDRRSTTRSRTAATLKSPTKVHPTPRPPRSPEPPPWTSTSASRRVGMGREKDGHISRSA